MLPDQTPQDLYQQQNLHQGNTKLPLGAIGKSFKPQGLGNTIPSKVFNNVCNSGYSSSKNLRNLAKTAQANNRYSSQNMKSFEFDDDNDHEDIDIADENFSNTMTQPQNQRRGSQRYKDRVRSLRVQSQETCMREGKPPSQNAVPFEENMNNVENDLIREDQDETLQDRQSIPRSKQYIQTEHNKYDARIEPSVFYPNDERWMTQPDQNVEEQFDCKGHFDSSNGAHFQYQELLKRLSDINHIKTENNSLNKTKKRNSPTQMNDFEQREPLREKTLDVINKQIASNSFKKTPQLESKIKRLTNNPKSKKNTQEQKKSVVKVPQNLGTQNKITKLLINNQENNFIDKKLKEQINPAKPKLIQTKPLLNHNKSHSSLHKSGEKNQSKIQNQQFQCQINNMKIKTVSSNDSKKSAQNSVPVNVTLKTVTQPVSNINATINNLFTNTIMSASTNSVNGFSAGMKCPSSNFLRTQTSAISTMLTQCSSNKQFNQSKETPEATSRQKFKLNGTIGTALSSTSKRGNGITTLSSGSQGNTIQVSSNFQTVNAQHDSVTKRSQGSDSKQKIDQQSSATRSNSNTTQKMELKKMMIKNNSFLKQTNKSNTMGRQPTDFYQTIYQKIQNNNFVLTGNTQIIGGRNSSQMRPSEQKKQSFLGESAKTIKLNGKVQSHRLSGQGSNHASIGSLGHGTNLRSPQSSSSPSQSRQNSQNNRESQQKIVTQPVGTQMSMSKVNQILKKLQDKTEPLLTSIRPSVNQNQQQQSILLQHQIKKQPVINRPFSGKLTRKPESIIQRKSSQESINLQQTKESEVKQESIFNCDNRKSLLEQHKTLEKKVNTEVLTTVSLKQNEKIGKFLAQKKQEQIINNQQSSAGTNPQLKKGVLISNIMMQKANKLKTELFERQHLTTEENQEDDVELMHDMQKYTNMTTEQCEQYAFVQAPPLSGQRQTQRVKIKAKIF